MKWMNHVARKLYDYFKVVAMRLCDEAILYLSGLRNDRLLIQDCFAPKASLAMTRQGGRDRHCDEALRRSNPVFEPFHVTTAVIQDCFAPKASLAMTRQGGRVVIAMRLCEKAILYLRLLRNDCCNTGSHSSQCMARNDATLLPCTRVFLSALFGMIALLGPVNVLFAQDPAFSQYNLNQYYYNPAYTGYHGGYQLAATYRSLWPNVPGRTVEGPLSTSLAVVDAFIKSGSSYTAGAGLFAVHDVEGEGYLTTNTVGISYAQHFAKIGPKSDARPRIQLSLGFKAYLNSISVNWDKLVFSDELSLQQGITGSSAAGHTGMGRKVTGDMDAGLLMINNFKGKDNWYNEVGFALAHILSPNESLTGASSDISRVPRKYVASYRSTVGLAGKRFFLGPTILFENQKLFYELNTGVDFFINPKPSNAIIPLCFSVMNRMSVNQNISNTNALIVSARYKGSAGKQNKVIYNIGFAADLPYSGLAMQTKGAYEISLGVILPPKGSNNFSKCPYQVY